MKSKIPLALVSTAIFLGWGGFTSSLPHARASGADSGGKCKVYPTGRSEVLSFPSGNAGEGTPPAMARYSPDGQTLAFGGSPHGLWLRNQATGGKIQAFGDSEVTSVEFSPDGKTVVAQVQDGLMLRDLHTGNESKIPYSSPINAVRFSPDGKTLAVSFLRGASVLRNLNTGEEKRISHQSASAPIEFSSDGKFIVTVLQDRTVLIRDQATGKEQKIIQSDAVTSTQFSPDGHSIVTASNDGTAVVRNLLTGQETKIEHRSRVNSAQFSPDGKSVVTSSWDGSSVVKNLVTGEQMTLSWGRPADSAQFSPDGRSVLVNAGNEVLRRDLKTGQTQTISAGDRVLLSQFSPDGSSAITSTYAGEVRLTSWSNTCADLGWQVEKSVACQTCCDQPVLAAVANLSEIDRQLRCGDSFDENHWVSGTSDASGTLGTSGVSGNSAGGGYRTISEAEANKLLLRFQKPGGFTPEKHLPVLLGMLKSDIPKKEPDLTLGVLQNVLLSSNRLYEQILKEFPELVKIKPSLSAGGANPCRTPAEVQQLERASENYLKELAKTHPRSQLKDWASLSPLVPVLRHLSPKKRDDYLDLVAQSLADQAADSPEFHGVFLSKLYKFTSQAAAPFFGGESKAMTDLTLVRDTDRIRPIILGSQAIDQSPKSLTDYGFYSRALDAIPVPSAEQINSQVKAKGSPALLSEQSVRWQVAGVPYQAQFSVKSQGFSGNPIPEGKAPNYGELWKNGTLTGLVITSSNLKNLAAPVMGEYLAYYQAQGFTFQPPTEVKDSARFLKDQIESGRLGYLIKEAHSDGDEKNLFRMDVQVRVQVGERKLPDGRTERIQLMFPDAGSTAPLPGGAALAAGTGATSAAAEPTTALLPNEVFGSWVKTREQNGQGQMVYLNTSCWSAAKAVREIEAAQSRALLNIPSTTTVKTFGNRPANAEQIILTAIRSGKSYEEMRTALKANQEYRRGEGNHFIFPDDREYQENISQYLRTPLDIRLNIQGPEGRPYSLDQVHD